jgi:hypothetical protein
MQQAINKNVRQNLPTCKMFLTDRRSKSLELQSHLPATVYMSRVGSPGLLHKDPHDGESLCESLVMCILCSMKSPT